MQTDRNDEANTRFSRVWASAFFFFFFFFFFWRYNFSR
jgi:hypothetical protein